MLVTDLDQTAVTADRRTALRTREAGYAVARKCLEVQSAAERDGTALRTDRGVALAPDAESWFIGAIGEIEVGALLAELGPEWLVLHSVPIGAGTTDVDHLLIGPAGVFALNTKHHRGASIWIGDAIERVGPGTHFYQRASSAEAANVSDRVQARSGLSVAVTPVLVMLGARSIKDARVEERDVRIVSAEDLVPWLAGLEPSLDESELQVVRAVAQDPGTWHSDPHAADTLRVMPRFERLRSDVTGLGMRQSPSVTRALGATPTTRSAASKGPASTGSAAKARRPPSPTAVVGRVIPCCANWSAQHSSSSHYQPDAAELDAVGMAATHPGLTDYMSTTAVGFRSERGPILIALMVSTGLIAIDSTVLATAVPSIVNELGGFSAFPWLFSVYLLAQAVSVPVYSKLADTLGRKPIILFGVGLFLLGSILCGFAWSMPALIAFRAVQGLGAGAVQPMAITIAGDIYTVAERARVQGYLASVWAISSVVGPTIGGLFSQLHIWRFIFFVNVPLCLIAGMLLLRNFKEQVDRRHHRIDYAGSVTLTGALVLIILGVLEGGVAWAWNSPQSIAVFAVGLVLLVIFVLVERRAAEPVLPLWVFRRRLLLTTSLIALGVGAVLIGLTSYVPTYLEQAVGAPPLVAGLALAALTLGWPIAATFSGRLLYLRFGFRPAVLVGTSVAIFGTAILVVFAHVPSIAIVAVACFVIGLGLGLLATPGLIAAQSSVEWDQRAVVTGTNLFSRSIGSSVGVAVFGAIANSVIAAHPSGSNGQATVAGVTDGTAAVFAGVLVVAAATLVAGLFMPKVRANIAPPAAPSPDAAESTNDRADSPAVDSPAVDSAAVDRPAAVSPVAPHGASPEAG